MFDSRVKLFCDKSASAEQKKFRPHFEVIQPDEAVCDALFSKFMGEKRGTQWHFEIFSDQDWVSLNDLLDNTIDLKDLERTRIASTGRKKRHVFIASKRDHQRFADLKALILAEWAIGSNGVVNFSLNSLFLFGLMLQSRYCCSDKDQLCSLVVPIFEFCHLNNVPHSTYQLAQSLSLNMAFDRIQELEELALLKNDPDALHDQQLRERTFSVGVITTQHSRA